MCKGPLVYGPRGVSQLPLHLAGSRDAAKEPFLDQEPGTRRSSSSLFLSCGYITTPMGFVFLFGGTWGATSILCDRLQARLAFRLPRKCAPDLMTLPWGAINSRMPPLDVINSGNEMITMHILQYESEDVW